MIEFNFRFFRKEKFAIFVILKFAYFWMQK